MFTKHLLLIYTWNCCRIWLLLWGLLLSHAIRTCRMSAPFWHRLEVYFRVPLRHWKILRSKLFGATLQEKLAWLAIPSALGCPGDLSLSRVLKALHARLSQKPGRAAQVIKTRTLLQKKSELNSPEKPWKCFQNWSVAPGGNMWWIQSWLCQSVLGSSSHFHVTRTGLSLPPYTHHQGKDTNPPLSFMLATLSPGGFWCFMK